MSGINGSDSGPAALAIAFTLSLPPDVFSVQRCASSSQSACSTSMPKRMCGISLLLGDAPDVGVDLRLRRERRAPLGVGREAERVQVTRHVASAAGVGVVAPGARD